MGRTLKTEPEVLSSSTLFFYPLPFPGRTAGSSQIIREADFLFG
jgi:hypothetical protein